MGTTEQRNPDIWVVARIPFSETERRPKSDPADGTKWSHHASREEAELAAFEFVPGTRCAMLRLSPDIELTFVGFEGARRVWLKVDPPVVVGAAREPGGKVEMDPKAMKYMGEIVKYGTIGAHAMRELTRVSNAN